MTTVIDFLGRLHPLVVHLPIGILCLAVVFVFASRGRYQMPQAVVEFTFLLGGLAAIVAVVSGLVLTRGDEYDVNSISWHKWMGITLSVAAVITWWIVREHSANRVVVKVSVVGTLILVAITGHLGGSITHGEHYLLEPISTTTNAPDFDASSVKLRQALFYSEVIQPILNSKCVTCHGSGKQKGGLRLDTRESLAKGGKNGKIFEALNPEESTLANRIELPLDHEDHMPPKERKQLSSFERDMIVTWIASGASFDSKLDAVFDSAKWASVQQPQASDEIYDNGAVPQPDPALLNYLTSQGVAITPIAEGSRYLQVNFVSASQASSLVARLAQIAENVVSLKVTGTTLEEASWTSIATMKNLVTLDLSKTNVSSQDLEKLLKLTHLRVINLSATKVDGNGVIRLVDAPSIQKVILFETVIDTASRKELTTRFPQVHFEFGGYLVPTLETDTTFIKTN